MESSSQMLGLDVKAQELGVFFLRLLTLGTVRTQSEPGFSKWPKSHIATSVLLNQPVPNVYGAWHGFGAA